ncbi:glycerophosphodiester phosphodiesterase [Jeotgalibacillus haloalkalitolerans]|uniref:Glycerophosphodiester phosphodiesterase n=1 Tax=Jeotgalibacillus haloalkalitolerans TaxID=3104292 RepID=A0ABU5KK84_9BACL|nr:glycerophosphodiester phosphodiesterase [Jeotgalibacillus sp. HH7-29]MDZ5711539.1 glycerophosphodiester phosphodiesterase [Jeotgalibacillus sp. HH7-29]
MGKKTNIGLALAASGAAIWAGTKMTSKPAKRPTKKFFEGEKPRVFAHRGGAALAPESSLAAFKQAAELGVDGFEIDIRMTKDEELVIFHDQFIDRTTNGAGRVADYTLSELKEFDLGYHFRDLQGDQTFRGKGEQVLSLKEALEAFPDKLFNIDMKEDPDTYEGSLMPSKLWRLIEKLGVEDRVLVTSFYDEQIDRFSLYSQDRVAIGAGENEARKAFSLYRSGFGHLYHPNTDAIQIPTKHKSIPLDSKGFIEFLTSLNIQVEYWTVNDVETMDRLLRLGADGIITDRPDIAMQLIKND